jgi:hypothetical protein
MNNDSWGVDARKGSHEKSLVGITASRAFLLGMAYSA